MTDGPSLEMVAFLATAAAALVSALFVVFHRNPVVNAVGLVVNLACIALLFLLLRAPFLAAMQVIIYTGAIMVLFLFVIMLLDLRVELRSPRSSSFQRGMAVAGGLALLGLLMLAIRGSRGGFTFQVANDPEFGSAEDVARVLFSDHLVPFELASVLLLVAMVGALMLARGLFDSPSEGK